ncbi:MAG: hypothetical protein KGH89_07625 [Thaumarchaeota archaeon]|nr:hypothetical protein [Nitrososphaerota archaeon]MDE1867863.1 hypothetical protein [Nitrososphaerota archaeon]
MRVNLEDEEYIIASLPKIWGIALGLAGFFHKSKEGVLALTDKNVIFAPHYLYITPKEREKYFGDDKARVGKLAHYSEADLDEDISKSSKSWMIPLSSIVNVESVTSRKVNFLRITFKDQKNKIKKYEFAITRAVINYPQRQPLMYYSLDWDEWVNLIKSHL